MKATAFARTLVAALLLFVTTAHAPASASAAAALRLSDLRGEWAWTCCDATYAGRFQITSIAPKTGTFSGRFMQTNASDVGTISGSLRGDRISFVRRVNYDRTTYEQKWFARLEYSDGAWRMVDGYWNGYGDTAVASRSFSAVRVT